MTTIKVRYLVKSKGWGGGGHRSRPVSYSGKHSVKSKSKSMSKRASKEETGEQILARIMREIWANIERKERH